MQYSNVIDQIHSNLSEGTLEYYQDKNIAPFLKVKIDVCEVAFISSPKLHRIAIRYPEFDKMEDGCITHCLSGLRWVYNHQLIKIPKLDRDDLWFNFSLEHSLSKDTFIKYLEIIEFYNRKVHDARKYIKN